MSTNFYVLIVTILLSNVYFNVADQNAAADGGDMKRIEEMQRQLITLQSHIFKLNSTIQQGNNSIESLNRLAVLDREFQTLKRRQSAAFEERRAALQWRIDEITKAEQQLNLADDIKGAIRSHQFKIAEEKLNVLGGKSKVQGIVHEVYAGSIKHFDVILEFSKTLEKIDLRLAILKALRYEMAANGHTDVYKLLALVVAMENFVVADSKASEAEIAMGRTTIAETFEDLKSALSDILLFVLYSNVEFKNVEGLLGTLNDFQPKLVEEVILNIVDKSFGTVASGKLLDSLYNYTNISQKISGMIALFHKLQSTGNFNNATMINLGDYLKRLQDNASYKSISTSEKDAVTAVISKLPMCVRSLFFEPYVCFYSRKLNAYVPIRWNVTRSGDKFYLEHANQFLSVALNPNLVKGGDEAAWNIELSGDFCYLRNVANNEYMFPDDENPEVVGHIRLAKTKLLTTYSRLKDFQWQLNKLEE